MTGAVQEQYAHRPGPGWAGWVRNAVGYRISGAAPGVHVGMPSLSLTLVVPIGERLVVQAPGAPTAEAMRGCLGGLHTSPAMVRHPGHQLGIQLSLRPSAARALFGVPAGELGPTCHELDDVLGTRARALGDRLAEIDSWEGRFALLERVLTPAEVPARPAELARAWALLVRGQASVRAVAADVVGSVRHLQHRMRTEVGLTPGEVIRLGRFSIAHRLAADPRARLADIAAACGYADQAHLAREWRRFAGMPPSRWRTDDELAFVQVREVAAQAG